MEGRLSAVREVLGLPAVDVLLLEQHDSEYFHDSDAEPSGAESATEETLASAPAAYASASSLLASDDEENLEDLDLANRSTGALAQPTEPAAKRKPGDPQPTTLEEVTEVVEQGCKCSGDKNCFQLLPVDLLVNCRRMTESISKNSRETFLAGKMDALARRGGAAHAGQTHGGPAQRERITYDYTVCGVSVCQAVFLYANSCTRYTLHKVQTHLESGCVVPPEHGSKGSAPWNVISPDESQKAMLFIQNYADVNGLPQPAAPRGHNGPAPIYLPCFVSKLMLHGLYAQAGGTMSYRSFLRVWSSMCADIVIMKPREDVCATCSDLQSRISRAITEEQRMSCTETLRKHITKAMDRRDHYRDCIARAKIQRSEAIDANSATCPYTHLTFDFAQQVTLPHHGRQVGALYFRVPRRIQVFGVANEAIPQQYNYLIDEHETIGKDGSKAHGPNAVVSMLHHHLAKHTSTSTALGLHADNCCGQNKNKTVVAYLAWRVLVGLNQEIQLDFMRVGHTRCFVDAGFGLLKQKYRKADTDTVQQLVDVVDSSASINEAETYCWEWHSWDSYFKDFFKPVKNITAYQRFVFRSSHPGKVELSESDELPMKTFDLRTGSTSALSETALPPVIQPAGMSHERALYLFKNIRQFCHPENRDITCPEPDGAEAVVEEEQQQPEHQQQQ